MAKKVKEFSAKGWKPNPELQAIADKGGPTEVSKYVKSSPNFTEKDYIDIMAGLYPNIDIGFGFGYAMRDSLQGSKFNKPTTNDKAVDFTYDVLDLKRDWNNKNPKNKVDLNDHAGNLRYIFHDYPLSSKMLHKLVSEPKYMLEDKYSDSMKPPTEVLKNDKIKPEHLYKFLTSHPEHVNELIDHDKSDSRLEDMIFDKPENLKNVSNSSLSHYLSKNLKREEGQEPKLNISPKRAKAIVENGHDKLYNDGLFAAMSAMDPADKKEFVDKKLGITGGKIAGLGAWRTNDEATNQEVAGKWNDWENGPEHDPKFSKRISSSPHLTDDQAEHIKRHGSFDDRYELYHNKDIDPKHGVEMFNMWHNDDRNKGYEAEQLQDRYKKDKDDVYTLDDIDPDLINEDDLYEGVDEATREGYDFSQWVDDNEDDLLEDLTLDDKHEEKLNDELYSDHDWKGENPNHNVDLHTAHQKILDNMEDDSMHVNKASELTKKTPKELEAHAFSDADGNIDRDTLEEYMKDNNPEEIDYSSSDNHTIDEHPEYEDRYKELVDKYKRKQLRDDPYSIYDDYYEKYDQSENYQQAYADNMKEAREEAAKEHYGELYASSHQDDRFIPEHLRSHIPNIEEIKANRKKAIGEPSDMLDKHIANRSYEHPYGEDQHLHEFLKDYADANGGSIDIGRMHKLLPAQGEAWKKIFGKQGKLTSPEIQQKIAGIQKTPYAISYGKWDSNKMQNLNNQDQIVFRLDHTDESLKPLQEDPELYRTFQKVQEVSKKSGHPTKDNTIAWARVDTTDPKHWMIDEVQSDFGKTVTQYLKDNNEEAKGDHVQKISAYHKNWREALVNAVLKEAKKHGANKVSTHSPESKASHTGSEIAHSVYQDSYKKVPRKMGFKPAPAQTLPITEKVKEGVFNKNARNDKESLASNHVDAWQNHKSWANAYNELASGNLVPEEGKARFSEYAQHHESMADQHRTRALGYGAKHEDVSAFPIVPSGKSLLDEAKEHRHADTKFEHGADKHLKSSPMDFSKQDYHEGHTFHLNPNLVKSMLDIVEDLVKFEIIWKNTQNLDIKKRAQINIDLIKDILGYEVDLSKWENRRRIFSNDLSKAEPTSPPQHNEQIRQVANNYAASRGLALNHNIPQTKVDPAKASKIADAYHQAQHNPSHPAVQKAYGALVNETNDQFKHMLNSGLKVSKLQPGQENPYKSSKDLFHDVKNNNHIWYYPTEQGFGSGSANSDHPLLQPTEHMIGGEPMLANDVFRIVHDYFGHAKEGNGFGPHGEEHAWKHHMQMYTPEAQKALTSETRGQNSWVNFGPHGEQNKKNPSNTTYADQKATLLPDWAMKHGPESVYSKLGKSENDLHKSPMVYDIDDVENVALSGYPNISKIIKRNKLKNGLEHRISIDPKTQNNFLHTLHKPGVKGPIAQIHVENRFHDDTEQKEPTVSHSVVSDKFKGKGYGKLLYRQAIQHHGNLTSDESMSGNANKMWEKLHNKNVATELAEYGDDPTPHRAMFVGKTPIERAFKKNQISGKHLQKLDILKGAMKKLAPFKPEFGGPEHEAIEEWTGHGDSDSSAREQIPPMSQNARVRALHRLGKHTEVRRHPQTGERMFLLHRGMANDEYLHNHKNGQSVYEPNTKTSWTPHVHAALGFAKDHKELSMDKKGKVVSAWIPESEIHSVPNQVLIPDLNNQFRNEHEIIVSHQTPHMHASKDLVEKARNPHKFLQTKINMKGHAETQRNSPQTPEDIHRDMISREDRAMQYRKRLGKKEIGMQTLEKGDLSSKIKTGLTGLALAASIGTSNTGIGMERTAKPPIAQQVQAYSTKAPVKINKEKNRILASIMDVESNNNKNRAHPAPHDKRLHGQERAYGGYGLMPLIIRETIKRNPALMKEHNKAMGLMGSDLHNYMDQHPGLEDKVASAHYDRLTKHFGSDPAKIGYAWLNGITGTNKAIKQGADINSHWHVQKVLKAYENRKKIPTPQVKTSTIPKI